MLMIIITMTNDSGNKNDNFQNCWTYVYFFLAFGNNTHLAVFVFM